MSDPKPTAAELEASLNALMRFQDVLAAARRVGDVSIDAEGNLVGLERLEELRAAMDEHHIASEMEREVWKGNP